MRFVVSGSRSLHLGVGSIGLAAAGLALAACSDSLRVESVLIFGCPDQP